MMLFDEPGDCAEMLAEQVRLIATSHPCDFCGAESRYLWTEYERGKFGRSRQACERCAPESMKKRAA